MVREAVSLERAELERLHKIDVAATALDQMVQDYERDKERLEGEIAAQRGAWETESRDAERDRKEQAAARNGVAGARAGTGATTPGSAGISRDVEDRIR